MCSVPANYGATAALFRNSQLEHLRVESSYLSQRATTQRAWWLKSQLNFPSISRARSRSRVCSRHAATRSCVVFVVVQSKHIPIETSPPAPPAAACEGKFISSQEHNIHAQTDRQKRGHDWNCAGYSHASCMRAKHIVNYTIAPFRPPPSLPLQGNCNRWMAEAVAVAVIATLMRHVRHAACGRKCECARASDSYCSSLQLLLHVLMICTLHFVYGNFAYKRARVQFVAFRFLVREMVIIVGARAVALVFWGGVEVAFVKEFWPESEQLSGCYCVSVAMYFD